MPDRAAAQRLDQADPLASTRARFALPEGVVYLDGNSLGALPVGVPEALRRAAVDQWGAHLVRAWHQDGWWDAPLRVGDRIARLLGAGPGQVVVGESTSVQIFNALAAAARLRAGRPLLLVDDGSFPTDSYLAASVASLLGLTIRRCAVPEFAETLRTEGEQVAVVFAGAVDYRTGELWDVPGVTAAAHAAGAVVVWDLCHAVGAVPLALDADGVDIAVGCTYKFLSGGPGSPAFSYVAERHQADFRPPLTGWNGHAEPFGMRTEYQPAAGIARARVGTPHLLSLAALDAALDAFDGVTVADVRVKNVSLGEFFLACLDEHGFDVITPRAAERRGSQVTVRHPDARPIMAALIERHVIGDVRPPNLLRFGFNGLYVSHVDIHTAVRVLRSVLDTRSYQAARYQVQPNIG
ncbi:MAG TPA: kynureninase [Pseudonocardiaceae bacterium]|jgi:kynureninase|nr:kynureninase [Pseudonocardiaceae bacterium]